MGNVSVYGTCTIAGCAASTPVRFVNNLTYDYVGHAVSGAGNVIGNAAWTPTYNSIGQLTVMNSNCIKWGGSSCTASGNLISNMAYNAFGLPISDSLDNGMSESWTYDKLGHAVLYSAGTGHYWFSVFRNSTDINASNDMINGNWNYSYDGTDRLSCAYVGSACNSSATEALSWGYDQYDNRIRQSVIAGTGFGSLYTINAKNQLTGSGFSYDAAGNMLNDTSHTYTYDAEGRIMTVDGGAGNGGETYNYNSRGLRNNVYFGSTAYERVFTPYGLPAALVDSGTGTMVTSEFYALGHLGTLQPGNSGYTTMFLLKDWLGTTREWADLGGNSYLSCQTFPYGEISGTGCPGNPGWSELGGLWYDGEDNTINTPARNYAISQGRWLTPDPAGLAAVDPSKPQTWNRYAYVLNNPVSFVDPSGLRYEGHWQGNCTEEAGPCPQQPDCIVDGVEGQCGLLSSLLDGDSFRLLDQFWKSSFLPSGEITEVSAITSGPSYGATDFDGYLVQPEMQLDSLQPLNLLSTRFGFQSETTTDQPPTDTVSQYRSPKAPQLTQQNLQNLCGLAVALRNNGYGSVPTMGSDPRNSLAYGTTVFQNSNKVMNPSGVNPGQTTQAAVGGAAQVVGRIGDTYTCNNHQ